MDPLNFGQKICELQACKDAVSYQHALFCDQEFYTCIITGADQDFHLGGGGGPKVCIQNVQAHITSMKLELRDRIADLSDHADFWTFSRSFPIPDFSV